MQEIYKEYLTEVSDRDEESSEFSLASENEEDDDPSVFEVVPENELDSTEQKSTIKKKKRLKKSTKELPLSSFVKGAFIKKAKSSEEIEGEEAAEELIGAIKVSPTLIDVGKTREAGQRELLASEELSGKSLLTIVTDNKIDDEKSKELVNIILNKAQQLVDEPKIDNLAEVILNKIRQLMGGERSKKFIVKSREISVAIVELSNNIRPMSLENANELAENIFAGDIENCKKLAETLKSERESLVSNVVSKKADPEKLDKQLKRLSCALYIYSYLLQQALDTPLDFGKAPKERERREAVYVNANVVKNAINANLLRILGFQDLNYSEIANIPVNERYIQAVTQFTWLFDNPEIINTAFMDKARSDDTITQLLSGLSRLSYKNILIPMGSSEEKLSDNDLEDAKSEEESEIKETKQFRSSYALLKEAEYSNDLSDLGYKDAGNLLGKQHQKFLDFLESIPISKLISLIANAAKTENDKIDLSKIVSSLFSLLVFSVITTCCSSHTSIGQDIKTEEEEEHGKSAVTKISSSAIINEYIAHTIRENRPELNFGNKNIFLLLYEADKERESIKEADIEKSAASSGVPYEDTLKAEEDRLLQDMIKKDDFYKDYTSSLVISMFLSLLFQNMTQKGKDKIDRMISLFAKTLGPGKFDALAKEASAAIGSEHKELFESVYISPLKLKKAKEEIEEVVLKLLSFDALKTDKYITPEGENLVKILKSGRGLGMTTIELPGGTKTLVKGT